TKVPYKAIMRYILHYTNPGDIIYDGYAGTGMTGFAAQMCNNKKVIESLGYIVTDDGEILDKDHSFSKIGNRNCIVNDLSPIATFISKNYNSKVNLNDIRESSTYIFNKLEEECNWVYKTYHKNSNREAVINYIVWIEVFICNSCTNEIVFWNEA